jgi:hypothetical protein
MILNDTKADNVQTIQFHENDYLDSHINSLFDCKRFCTNKK